MVFLGGFSAANASWAEVADAVLKEAQELKKLENEYFNKRLNNDLRGAYQYQHPKYKKEYATIPAIEMAEELIRHNYRSGWEQI